MLATMMERWEENPSEGFAEYQRYRAPRLKRMLREGRKQIDELLTTDRRARALRNLKWGLASRYLPEATMARQDWLFGYDCIKGFA